MAAAEDQEEQDQSLPSGIVTIENLKSAVNIRADDEKYNEKLAHIVSEANTEIENILTPYLNETPITPGTDIYDNARQLGLAYGRALWFERNFQYDKYRINDNIYKAKKDTIITALKATRSTRTTTTVVSKNIKNYPLSPSNAKGAYLNY